MKVISDYLFIATWCVSVFAVVVSLFLLFCHWAELLIRDLAIFTPKTANRLIITAAAAYIFVTAVHFGLGLAQLAQRPLP